MNKAQVRENKVNFHNKNASITDSDQGIKIVLPIIFPSDKDFKMMDEENIFDLKDISEKYLERVISNKKITSNVIEKFEKLCNPKKWSRKSIKILENYYRKTSDEDFDLSEVSRLVNRSKSGTALMASRLGFSNNNRRKSEKTIEKYKGTRNLSKESRKLISERTKKWHNENHHPKGFKGHKHSDKAKKKISNASKDYWKRDDIIQKTEEYKQKLSDRMSKYVSQNKVSNPYSRSNSGVREDIGKMYFRSSWEANYARYLNFLIKHKQIKSWEYEPETFWFEAIKRGVRSYKPDFKILENDGSSHFVEVKGWMDPKSLTKLKRMKKYYPKIEVRVVGEKEYKGLKKSLSGLIEGWE